MRSRPVLPARRAVRELCGKRRPCWPLGFISCAERSERPLATVLLMNPYHVVHKSFVQKGPKSIEALFNATKPTDVEIGADDLTKLAASAKSRPLKRKPLPTKRDGSPTKLYRRRLRRLTNP